ncbi:MAG TPA: cupin domain-containing protein [Stellaceae bacterium]|nr:cupin domain-containing protein [Stellaceae bacterium]
MTQSAFDLVGTYVQLSDGAGARQVPVTEDFWSEIDDRPDLAEGRLVCVFPQRESWSIWEMHPAGDEIVCLLSGAIDLVLDDQGMERVVELRGRAACIVPRGVWHRAIVRSPGDALFITRGAGTEHRPV